MNILPPKLPLEFSVQIYKVIPFAAHCPYGQVALLNMLIIRIINERCMDMYTHIGCQCDVACMEWPGNYGEGEL